MAVTACGWIYHAKGMAAPVTHRGAYRLSREMQKPHSDKRTSQDLALQAIANANR
jgi:hypothetical protein